MKQKRLPARKKTKVKKPKSFFSKKFLSYCILALLILSLPIIVLLSLKKSNSVNFADTTEIHSCTKQQADNGTPGVRSCDGGNGCQGTQYHQYYAWEDKNGNGKTDDTDTFSCTWSSCVAPFTCPAGVSPNPTPKESTGPGISIGGSDLGVQLANEAPIARLKKSNYKDVGWVKFQYPWAHPDQPVETWVQEAKKNGYKVLISVAKKPTNSATGSLGYAQFGIFMENLAKKLGKDVDAYEIWNEPNLNDEWQGWGDINPAEYVKLLKAGYEGVKKGNPQTTVVSAGLAPFSGDYDDNKFYTEFINAGGLNYLDAVGWHSNVTRNIPPEDTTLQGFQRVKLAIASGKPVYLTEFGWARDLAGISRDTQDSYIKKAHEIAPTLGNIQAMIIWNFGFTQEPIDPSFAQWDVERFVPSPTPTPSPLPAPSNLKASCTIENKVLTLTFSWNKVDNAKAFAIRVDKDPGTWGEDTPKKGDTVKNDLTTNTYKRCGHSGATYAWWVHSIDSRGVYSQKSVGKNVTCTTLTPVPTCAGICQQTFIPTQECKE